MDKWIQLLSMIILDRNGVTIQNHVMSKEDQRIHPYPVRLTKELREKLDAAAKAAGRSLNAEMLLRLEASFLELSADEQPLTAAQVRDLIREELTKAGK